jgi:hypothetical protein
MSSPFGPSVNPPHQSGPSGAVSGCHSQRCVQEKGHDLGGRDHPSILSYWQR